MKWHYNLFIGLFLWGIAACSPPSAEKQLAQLSPAALQALESGMQAQCSCIAQHQQEVDALMNRLDPLIEGLASGVITDAGEAGIVYIKAMQKAQGFTVCLAKAEAPETQQTLEAAEEELDQLFAGLNEEEQLDQLLRIYTVIAKEECPGGATIIRKLQQLSQQILRL